MKSMMIVATFFAICGIANGAYTYTFGPGEHINPSTLQNHESMLIQGGWGDHLNMFDWSSARIESTTPLGFMTGGMWEMSMGAYSSATITGGEFNVMYVEQYSHLTMSGGKLNELYGKLYLPIPAAPQDKYIQFISKSWDYNSNTKKLTGVWGNDSTFNIQLIDTAGYANTFNSINFTIVPEPVTFALLGIGAGLLRMRRSRT